MSAAEVTGTDRDDWLLSLDVEAVAHREALMAMAFHLARATLVGNPAPIVDQMCARIRVPRIGDLVVEQTSSGASDPRRRLHMFGVLLEARLEPKHSDPQWARLLADGEYDQHDRRPADRVWYVQFGPSALDVCRWTDAMFLAVPIGRDFFDTPPTGHAPPWLA